MTFQNELRTLARLLSMNLTMVGTSRCDVSVRERAGGIVAPLNAARTAQRAVPTRFWGSRREASFRRNLSPSRWLGALLAATLCTTTVASAQAPLRERLSRLPFKVA